MINIYIYILYKCYSNKCYKDDQLRESFLRTSYDNGILNLLWKGGGQA